MFGEPQGCSTIAVLHGHEEDIVAVKWAPDGKQLASVSMDNTLRVWDAETWTLSKTINLPGDGGYDLAWGPSTRSLVVNYDRETLLWFDMLKNSEPRIAVEQGFGIGVRWSAEGHALASVYEDEGFGIKIWDSHSYRLMTRLFGHFAFVNRVEWSPIGRMLASGSDDKTVILWDMKAFTHGHTLEGHTDVVTDVCWAPDATAVASASADNTVRLWDVKTGRCTFVLEHEEEADAVGFSYDGKLLASVSGERWLHLWDPQSGKALHRISLDLDSPGKVAFHPSRQWLATVDGHDTAIHVLNLSSLALSGPDRRFSEVDATMLRGKSSEQVYYDVFLAHNSRDKSSVEAIKAQLEQRGLRTWLDKEQVPPGRWFQQVIQEAIPKVRAAAIVIGPNGVGKWQAVEQRVFIAECVERGIPVIPVFLPGVREVPEDLLFLKQLNPVRFVSLEDPDALDALVWGITGSNPTRNER